jgi:hypothetical protein
MKNPLRKKLKKAWENPVKGSAAKESTMNTPGDFTQFTELMKRVIKAGKPTSASPGPGVVS